jgi:hypothetical protein
LKAFDSCTSLPAITVNASNSFYSSVDGVLCNQSQTTLIQYPGGKAGSYTVPNSITNIGSWAFDYSNSLTNVTLGNSVTSIGSNAFAYCYHLTNVVIASSVTRIEERVFYYSQNLTGVYFQGNAPNPGSEVFDGNIVATVYYLPGTTGWGPTFGGRPTALWQPTMQGGDAGFGVQTNQFGFNIAWASGQVVVVEAATDLTNPSWLPLQTNTLTADKLYFSDPQWTNYPERYYRLRSA